MNAKKLYVGNLSYQTSEDGLRAFFQSAVRDVEGVTIVMDRMTGRSRGFAFVELSDDDAAKVAIETCDGRELDGRPLRVNDARHRDEGRRRFF